MCAGPRPRGLLRRAFPSEVDVLVGAHAEESIHNPRGHGVWHGPSAKRRAPDRKRCTTRLLSARLKHPAKEAVSQDHAVPRQETASPPMAAPGAPETRSTTDAAVLTQAYAPMSGVGVPDPVSRARAWPPGTPG